MLIPLLVEAVLKHGLSMNTKRRHGQRDFRFMLKAEQILFALKKEEAYTF